jgi:hypothetical protein
LRFWPNIFQRSSPGGLNLFHIAAAFAVQYATGVVLQHWPPQAGHYPEIAYQTAFAVNLVLQIVALIWFALPGVQTLWRRRRLVLLTGMGRT